ncbi:MAG: hypothetical protein KAJ72_09280, partial [Candidatus Heimdallarchaeota archaeon]|nr:hypothetical protein [Candidatus Heimdallarchaeota archaeon]
MLSKFLEKSIVSDGITHIAGPPNSGKTTILYHLCKGLKKGKKALILDCEINFSARRLREITLGKDIDFNNIILLRVADKANQIRILMKLHSFFKKDKPLFIGINGFTNHFRFSPLNVDEMNWNKTLSLQMAYLQMVSSKLNLPVVLTNQVSMFRENNLRIVRPFANSIITNYSDNNIMLEHVNKKLWKA